MNKIQQIELLALRGITELNEISVGDAISQSGGEPTEKEMVIVNEMSMNYYIDKYAEQKDINEKLSNQNNFLLERERKLTALESAGVDNWNGYDIAMDMM